MQKTASPDPAAAIWRLSVNNEWTSRPAATGVSSQSANINNAASLNWRIDELERGWCMIWVFRRFFR